MARKCLWGTFCLALFGAIDFFWHPLYGTVGSFALGICVTLLWGGGLVRWFGHTWSGLTGLALRAHVAAILFVGYALSGIIFGVGLQPITGPLYGPGNTQPDPASWQITEDQQETLCRGLWEQSDTYRHWDYALSRVGGQTFESKKATGARAEGEILRRCFQYFGAQLGLEDQDRAESLQLTSSNIEQTYSNPLSQSLNAWSKGSVRAFILDLSMPLYLVTALGIWLLFFLAGMRKRWQSQQQASQLSLKWGVAAALGWPSVLFPVAMADLFLGGLQTQMSTEASVGLLLGGVLLSGVTLGRGGLGQLERFGLKMARKLQPLLPHLRQTGRWMKRKLNKGLDRIGFTFRTSSGFGVGRILGQLDADKVEALLEEGAQNLTSEQQEALLGWARMSSPQTLAETLRNARQQKASGVEQVLTNTKDKIILEKLVQGTQGSKKLDFFRQLVRTHPRHGWQLWQLGDGEEMLGPKGRAILLAEAPSEMREKMLRQMGRAPKA